MTKPPASLFVGITGASGAPYAVRLVRALAEAGCELTLCLSEAGVAVVAHELELGVTRPRRGDGGVSRRRRGRGARLRARRSRGARGQRQQLPRRGGRLPVLDVDGGPHRARHDADPDPPGRRRRPQGGPTARARAARDAAVRDPPGAAARGAPRRRRHRGAHAGLLRAAAHARRRGRLRGRQGAGRPWASSSGCRGRGRARAGERNRRPLATPSASPPCSTASCPTTTS